MIRPRSTQSLTGNHSGSARILGRGEMADAIRSHPWESTVLGPIEVWPSELVTAVNMLLSSKLISCLIWGEEDILIYNDLYRPLLGNKTPTLGESFLSVWPELRAQAEAILSEPRQTGEANTFERMSFFINLNGELVKRICFLTNNPVWALTETGPKMVGLHQTVIDHTESALAERQLLESQSKLQQSYAELRTVEEALRQGAAELNRNEERFRTFVEAVSDVVYRVSADWSEALQVEGRGFLPDTHAPDPNWFTRNVHPDDQSRVLAAIQKSVREESVFQMEHKVQRVDGTIGWTFSRAIPVRDEGGKVVEWFGAASDITARKQAEHALLGAEKLAAVGRLASSIAHEINNPLEAVTNLLYLAEQTADPETKRTLETAQQELQRVSQITTNTLGFNRQKARPEPVDVLDTMQSVLDLYRGRFKQAAIKVVLERRDCPPLTGFGGEMRQVFANLIGNALDALGRGGTIQIRIRPVTDWRTGKAGIRITVADNGHGMNAKTKAQVYKPFFTTKEHTGTGLGLWISSEIVHRHNGSMKLRSSDSEGCSGTTFSLLLPLDSVAVSSGAADLEF